MTYPLTYVKGIHANMSDKEREFFGAIMLAAYSHSKKKPSDNKSPDQESS